MLPLSDQPEDGPAAPWRAVRARMAATAQACGRGGDSLELVAVSKQQPWAAVAPVLTAGQRRFGENRVQEAQARWASVRGEIDDLRLHLIGPLQTNKVRQALALFDVVETLDRDSLAQAIAAAALAAGGQPTLYVQVNTGEEPQRAGVAPVDADGFIARVRNVHGLAVEGLMAIPPQNEPPGPHFALLAKIAERNGIARLSMGMSGDFEAAIRFGATSVRVGSAVFGARDH